MADSKISALPASTTPLAGTEVLPIVQSSATKQVTVANLTAGRAVATGALTVTGDATLSTGNIVQGTAAKGINFTANTPTAGMTSQLLNWYEEGTWTPNQGSGLTVIGAFSSSGKYTRIGRQVTAYGSVAGATSIAVGNAYAIICTTLPCSTVGDGVGIMVNSAATANGVVLNGGNILYSGTTMAATNNLTFSITYQI